MTDKDEVFRPQVRVEPILAFLSQIFERPPICSCPPDFVVMWQAADGDWMLGTFVDTDKSMDESIARGEPLAVFMAGIEAQARADAELYLAGGYVRWEVHCRHCGFLYDARETAEGLWS